MMGLKVNNFSQFLSRDFLEKIHGGGGSGGKSIRSSVNRGRTVTCSNPLVLQGFI